MRYYTYLVTNKITDQIYIGLTKDPEKRWTKHKRIASGSREKEKFYLHRSIKKYGAENFSFEVIETTESLDEAKESEQFHIAYLKAMGAELLNLTEGGEGAWGRVMSEETRKKIGDAGRGRKHTEEIKKFLSEDSKKRFENSEYYDKVKKQLQGLTDKLRGVKFSEEKKQKYRVPKSEIGRLNIGLAQKKKYENPEYKQKMIDNLARVRNSPEYKEKIRGENSGMSKLTEKEVLEIREKYSTGKYTHKQLAEEYNVKKQTVTGILKNHTWTHIKLYDGSYNRKGCSKLTREEIKFIQDNYKEMSIENLAQKFNVHKDTIRLQIHKFETQNTKVENV